MAPLSQSSSSLGYLVAYEFDNGFSVWAGFLWLVLLEVPVLFFYRYAQRNILSLSRFSQSEHNRISVVPFGTII